MMSEGGLRRENRALDTSICSRALLREEQISALYPQYRALVASDFIAENTNYPSFSHRGRGQPDSRTTRFFYKEQASASFTKQSCL